MSTTDQHDGTGDAAGAPASATEKGEGEGETPAAPPNVLCLVMDQLRFDHLGCYGNPIVKTPNIDRLAERGVLFDRAYVCNPLCMPARASWFTGLTPRGHGVRTNGIPLDPRVPTMTQALRDAGYHTHAVGKLHLQTFGVPNGEALEDQDLAIQAESRQAWEAGLVTGLPEGYYGLESGLLVNAHGRHAFGDYRNWIKAEHPEILPLLEAEPGTRAEDWTERCDGEDACKWEIPEAYHYNHWIAERTIDFLRAAKGEERPFFCWTSFPDPHHPYMAPKPYCDMYDPATIPLPNRDDFELRKLPPFYEMMYGEGPEERWGRFSGRGAPTDVSDDALRHMIAMTYAMITSVDAQIGRVLEALEAEGLAENTVVVVLSDHGDMMGDHWMLNKGPFHFEGLVRNPMIWSCPDRFVQNVRTAGLASQIDFAPTILDLCGATIPEGRKPATMETRRELPPWPGKSLLPVLQGQAKKVRDWVIIENDEDYLPSRVRSFVTNRYKITIYGGHEDWGELFDLQNDPQERRNLWDDPAAQRLKTALITKLMYCYLEEETPLPRRLTHA